MPKIQIVATVLSCTLDDWSENKGGYHYTLWIETPVGNIVGKGSPVDCKVQRKVGEQVTCEIVSALKKPNKNELREEIAPNWYKVL